MRRDDDVQPDWLAWARRLNALAQTGLAFAEDPYDIERYAAIRAIAADDPLHHGRLAPARLESRLSACSESRIKGAGHGSR
jgi:hypothetical protein